MYDPAYSVSSSHKASSSRLYIMNVLGVQKQGFWASLPNRYSNPYGNDYAIPAKDTGIRYSPQISKYVSQQIQQYPSKSKAPDKITNQTFNIDPGPKQDPYKIKGFGEVPGYVTQKEATKDYITVAEDTSKKGYITTEVATEGAVKTAKTMKPKPKKATPDIAAKPQATKKKIGPAISNQNYYKPTIYNSQVKSGNLGGY